MEKKPIGYKPGKPSVLEKKVPKNPKYQHIESTLVGKTGLTVKDVEVVSIKYSICRQQSCFKSKGRTFQAYEAQYIIKVDPAITQFIINIQNYSVYITNKPEPQKQSDSKSQISSTFTSVTIKTSQLPMNLDTEFLLLDLREPEDFDQFHITEAVNYPAPNIRRDKYLQQLYLYKNKENKIIVVYHFDEKKGIEYASQMMQRGYENIYLLNGGIEGFAQEIQGLLQGKKIPEFKRAEDPKKFTKRRQQNFIKK